MDELVAWLRGVLDAEWDRIQGEIDEMGFGDLTPSTDDHWHLADIEAKRAVLDAYAETRPADTPWDETAGGVRDGLGVAVRLLAGAYAHRPGYPGHVAFISPRAVVPKRIEIIEGPAARLIARLRPDLVDWKDMPDGQTPTGPAEPE